ncbi:acyl-CoA dehydrogenase family protein [Nocardioides sp. AE5]|uniref:acyl-CoA dehydrogenase family protein n=1 Tax=Nocardioides sp. AE5 TaxID=2962573 RepID=UPI002881DE3E|nr:acyl-CoA dehydrogenase family protein [Nocardioides sp. AE5]MDT0203057.1 acyl-CoA dehydrogenase family protein [Nocardioides sp. AE5]
MEAGTGGPEALTALREEVREFIEQQRVNGRFRPEVDSWLAGWDEEFSRALGAKGWLGMSIPREHGGHGRSYLERYVVTEELLCAGAPVAAHWIADRQIAPALVRFGTREQREEFLPAIARGESYWAIGMSEPDAGSDLASVRTRATRVEGGWQITGTKVWTSGAHRAHAFFVLARSAPRSDGGRHDGLSQFLVRLDAPGVTVSPIHSLDGSHHFNEVSLDAVFVPDGDVLGEIGNGWHQVTSELKFERSGPERFLSVFPALQRLTEVEEVVVHAPDDGLGHHFSRLVALHHLSFDVACRLQDGAPAEVLATMVKEMGTRTEGDLADDLADWASRSPHQDTELARLLADGLTRRAGFTLRGGTNEILRGLVAKGMDKQQAGGAT